MTDEEMAEEYAEANKEVDWEGFDKNKEELKQAFLAGLKAGRPQWHKVIDGDLPKDTTSLYLVRVYSWNFSFSHLYKKYTTYIPTVCEWNGEYFSALDEMAYSNARNIKNCIAWKEIVLPKESEIKREMFPKITLPEGSAEFVDKAIADAERRVKEIE